MIAMQEIVIKISLSPVNSIPILEKILGTNDPIKI